MEVLEEVAEVEVFPDVRRQISLQETIAGAARSDYLVGLHGNFVPAEVFDANPHLKGVAFLGGLTMKVDFEAALKYRVPVVSSMHGAMSDVPGGPGAATADLTVSMVLAHAYRLLDADRYTRACPTFQEQTMALMGLGCPGKTVGLVGLGRVGRPMARRFRAFDMRILYNKRTRLAPEEEDEIGIEWMDFDTLLAESDFVCVEVSYNPSTHKMFGAREFALMKPTAYFINTARGRIVDEDALIDALESKMIAGAALDVYYNEPSAVWDPQVPAALREMHNVILAPHNGNATYEVRNRQIMPLAVGIRDLIEGRRPAGLMNPEIYGAPTLYPQFYGRGPIFPIDAGPTHFLST